MNVYEKLNKARVEFQNSNIKKSGLNKFSGYSYYELSDFLPTINKLGQELKFTCCVDFSNDIATLEFIDSEKTEDRIRFSSPMSKATLKGCHEVQNLGAVETYIKRYLYQNCFEIVESDILDAEMNPNEKQTSNAVNSEIQKMIGDVQNAISQGFLSGDLARKANMYCQKGDIDGLKKVLRFLAENE